MEKTKEDFLKAIKDLEKQKDTATFQEDTRDKAQKMAFVLSCIFKELVEARFKEDQAFELLKIYMEKTIG